MKTPDHTTLSRRARASCIELLPQPRTGPLHVIVDATGLKIFGQGEWAACKHGARKAGPGWRKLHVGVDSDGVIVAAALTAATTADANVVPDLVEQVDVPIERFVADGPYDRRAVYGAVLAAGLAPRMVVPPIRTATVAGPSEPALAQRDATIEAIGRVGRRRWQKMAGHHQQARADSTFSRFKRIFGPRLRARDEEAQIMEASVACDVLNRMSSLGIPDSVAVLAP